MAPSSPPFPELTAPHRTLTNDKQAYRRPSLYQSNHSSPVSPNTAYSFASTLSPSTSPPALGTKQHQQQQHNQQHAQPALSASTSTSTSTTATTTSSTTPLLTPHLNNPTHHFTAAQTAALKALSSTAALDPADHAYWTSLLVASKFPPAYTPQDAFDLEMETVALSIELATNNVKTRNFHGLVLHLLSQAHLLLHHHQQHNTWNVPTCAYNALFLVRVFIKHFIGNLSPDALPHQFAGPDDMSPISPVPDTNKDALVPDQLPILQKITDDPRPTTEHLLDTVLKLLIDLDPSANYNTYEFYVELLNLMVVLFSTQMHHSPNAAPNLFLDLLLTKFADRANAIVAKLLDIVIEQKGPPAQSSSMVFSAYNYLFASRSSAADADTLLVADRSLLVILLLCTQSHLYRRTIASLRNLQLLSSDLEDHDPTHLISYKALFNIFCQSIHVEEHMLLFYLLLIENESFRVYVLSRTDPETIYIPILKMIYESIEQRTNFSQIYILMVILLIFSQDEVNNDTMQKVMVSNIPWFTERPLLRSVSLGSLTMLVLIRVLQFNLSHQKDIYFHTNCLAILANMAGSTLDMHSYVAQRLTGVFELIARRYQKWSAKLMSKEDDVAMTPTTDGGASDDGSASSVTTSPPAANAMPALPVDMTVYEDLLMLMLEIMNAVLTHRLMHNAQLVYCLLLKRDLFKSLHLQPRFAPVVSNIDTVINYFHVRVAEAQLKSPSSTEVLALIEQAARTWPANRLQPLPDLKFQYEEDQDCHQFFVPYVWALIHRRTYMYWSEDTSHVLDAYRLVQEPAASTSTPLSPPQA